MSAFGVHGCSVVTALTAQNTMGVQAEEPVSESMLRAQLQALANDLPPTAIKTGMLGSAESCRVVAECLPPMECPIVCDPVLKSTSGTCLLDSKALDVLKAQLFPYVSVLTPNLPETQQLLGRALPVEDAAKELLKLGVYSVLIKGGHAEGGECCDYWTDGEQAIWWSSPRIETSATHGTGCILSSAIASAIALGQKIPKAVVTAKTFLNQCLKTPANVGAGPGPMMIEPFRDDPQDRPDGVVGRGVDSAKL